MKLTKLTIAVLALTLGSIATAAPSGKVKSAGGNVKVNTNVKSGKTSTVKGGTDAAKGFTLNGALGAGLATGEEVGLDKATAALNACSGTPMIADISKAMPSSSESSAVLRYSSVLSGKVQGCQSGEKITDPQALINFGRLIINMGQMVESGAKATDINAWAQSLQKAIQFAGGSITLEQAKANIAGLQSSECKMLQGISI